MAVGGVFQFLQSSKSEVQESKGRMLSSKDTSHLPVHLRTQVTRPYTFWGSSCIISFSLSSSPGR
ncbi:hypothetical protein DFAR_1470040 [Desulfarculales bacterium]